MPVSKATDDGEISYWEPKKLWEREWRLIFRYQGFKEPGWNLALRDGWLRQLHR
jgi:hypothetical protein